MSMSYPLPVDGTLSAQIACFVSGSASWRAGESISAAHFAHSAPLFIVSFRVNIGGREDSSLMRCCLLATTQRRAVAYDAVIF